MTSQQVTDALCLVANFVISEAAISPAAPFSVSDIQEAANRPKGILLFLTEVTSRDGGLNTISGIQKNMREAAEINRRLRIVIEIMREDRGPISGNDPWLHLLAAIVAAIQRAPVDTQT